MVGPEFAEFKHLLLTRKPGEQRLVLCLALMRLVPQIHAEMEIGPSEAASAQADTIDCAFSVIWAVWAHFTGLNASQAGSSGLADKLAELLITAKLKGQLSARLQVLMDIVSKLPSAQAGFPKLLVDALEAKPAFAEAGLSAAAWNLNQLAAGRPLREVAADPLWPDVLVEQAEDSWDADQLAFRAEAAGTRFSAWAGRLERRVKGEPPLQSADFPLIEAWTGPAEDPHAAPGLIAAVAETAANDNMRQDDD